MREDSDAKGLVFVSNGASRAGVFAPEPVVAVDSSREVVPVARIRCTR